MPRSYLNPDRPRCAWCDAPFRDQAALIEHQIEHRNAEDLASDLKEAADRGLSLQEAVDRAKVMADELVGIDTNMARLDERALRTLINAVTP